jgi:class 3 adenylate cyclase/tetratricopeptide (TPR) repeat protein
VDEASPAQSRNDGERRHLTVMFCDLVGSTEISARLDPEELREVESNYNREAAEAITRFGGYVAKYLGDGILAYFGWPEAHDNDAERAARAGLAIVDAIDQLNLRVAANRPRLSVRVGIDSGVAVIGHGGGSESEIFGDTTNVASRVQAAADPDTVLVTPTVNRLISGLFVIEECGAHQLKGMAEPVELYRIVRLSGARSRLAASAASDLTAFVGREDELRLLWNRWERASDGEGQVVLISGEAGIGKSRLVRQFRERLAGTRHTWHECTGAPYFQNTPFHPIADMLLQSYSERGCESDEAKLVELERDLGLVGLKLNEAVPLVAQMLNIPMGEKYPALPASPEQKRKRLLATLAGWLFGTAQAQPVVMAVEDLRWFDASSLELIQLLVEQGATSPLLLLCTARREFHASWSTRAHHSYLTLNRLSSHHVRELVGQVVATNALSKEAIDKVVERTGGVPLFVEELTRAVLEKGDARPGSNEIPATLHASLMARLDRLGPAKEVAQIASVLGREFTYELLLAVSTIPEDDLLSALAKLGDAELIHASGVPPDTTYSFRHALIQDTAYEALLKSRRRELHRRVAVAMTEQFPEVAEIQIEVAARHWTEAAEAELAAAAWKKAGDTVSARGAFTEAEQDYRQSLAMLNTLPESTERDTQELTLQLALGGIMFATQSWSGADTAAVYARARTLAARTDAIESVEVFFGLWVTAVTRGELRAALALADQLLEVAPRVNHPRVLLIAHLAQGMSRMALGDLVAGRQFMLKSIEHYREEDFQSNPEDYGASALIWIGHDEWLLGFADQAQQHTNDARALGRRLNRPFTSAYGDAFGALTDGLRGDFARAHTASQDAERLSVELGFPQLRAISKVVGPWAGAQLGDLGGAVDSIRAGIAELDVITFYLHRGLFLYLLAETQAFAGDVDDALITVEQALETTPEVLCWRPLTLRLRGELRLRNTAGCASRLELAEQDLRAAIELARHMKAKSPELRATTSLARMLAKHAKLDEARAMLAEIYNWFTEGFDIADLKDAKALLDELGKQSV